MTETNELNERSIKVALTQGYITPNEADTMLKVYLHKLNPYASPHNKLKTNITA